MKRVATIVLAVFATVVLAGAASAALRVPQVPVAGGALQGYLNSVGESINVNTDQNAAQTWVTTVSNNSTFTLMIELGAFAPNNAIGVYNAADAVPALYQVFPGAATAGWFATTSWRSGPTRVIVNLFDQNAVFQGSTTYLGADGTNFAYYLSGPGGLFYTQDYRNPAGAAYALAFAGTGNNVGQWWLAMEDLGDFNFSDAVLFLESVNPTPVNSTSWGQLKRRFR
jgi:hypothetical protein